jgi:L-alanine-DL-glutamate epimerase-like enolase superfamily enzyme
MPAEPRPGAGVCAPISSVEAVPVTVRRKPEIRPRTAYGIRETSDVVLVRVRCQDGTEGVGEATGGPGWSGETQATSLVVIRELLGPAVIGLDPSRLDRIAQRLAGAVRHHPFAKAAIEMACFDIVGKRAGLPVYQLLGGKFRDEIPIRFVVTATDPEQAAKIAAEYTRQGFGAIKVKVGFDRASDVRRVRAVRQAIGPAVKLTVDANMGWDVPTAIAALRDLEDANLLAAEQPVRHDDPRWMADVRHAVGVPIMADESVFTLSDALRVLRDGAADILSVYPGKHGGLLTTLKIAAVAEAAGALCSVGSNLELGVGSAAMAHAAAAVGTIASERYPGDIIGPLYHEDDILVRPLDIRPGLVRVPEGAGLGVEVDWEKVAHLRPAESP